MYKLLKYFCLCSFILHIFVCLFFQPALASPTPPRIVLDPGHGGDDEGTYFDDGIHRVTEKALTLKLAKNIARILNKQGYRVLLTRNKDKEVSLPARTHLANKLKADLFISIHMNSTFHPRKKTAEGIETFILSHTSDASSRRLAHLENSVFSSQLSHSNDQDIAVILKDMQLDANLSESKRLACSIQNNLVKMTSPPPLYSRRNRGVKQALFHVLLGADMPSVLVEAGFLSNKRDRSLLTTTKGQKKFSTAIALAIEQFLSQRQGASNHSNLGRCKFN